MSRTSVVASVRWAVLTAAILTASPLVCRAQNEMSYMLLEGSTLLDDCTICGRPTFAVPLRGTFLLAFREENPLFTTYDMEKITFTAANGTFLYSISGEGIYEIGGEVALTQRMQLKLQVNDLPDIELSSGQVLIQRYWPMIEVEVSEEPVDPLRVYTMHLIAAPVREIWFSTTSGFTTGTPEDGLEYVSAGSLLSNSGHVVKSNSELLDKLGLMPVLPDVGLNAVDIAPGGDLLFSIENGVHSETLGELQHGDLLSDGGRIVRRNQDLTARFVIGPPVPDVGLDAVQMMPDKELLFSIEEDIFSEGLGSMLRKGDLLSDKGVVHRTNEQLLEKFKPVKGQGDVGLDAIHVWPNREIWFSTEIGFQSETLGPIADGHLLSDNGSIIFRNLELLERFAPLEKRTDFGLDAMFLVVEDYLAASSVREMKLTVEGVSRDLRIEWRGDGKVFQLEQADDPAGPYLPLSPINTKTLCIDPAALSKNKSFYRILEW
jgi:hypothetical protein